jgi:DNA polymerase-3 subunit alpha
VHSSFSIRDSVAKIPDLVSRAKELGMTSLGISEHGFLGSSYKFYKECKKQGVHPVTGFEAYMFDDIVDNRINYHLCLYAKNNIGYKNLCKLSSDAYINNFYKKPRVSFKSLEQYKEGIIVTSACMQSLPAQLVIGGNIREANNQIDKFHKLFGDDFYLEIHNHGIDEEVIVKDHFRNYGKDKGIKVIAGTDVHYIYKDDKSIHNIFKQIAYNSVGSDKDDSFNGDGYHLLSYDEMLERFEKEEVDNTLEIAEKCNVSFEHYEYHLPKFPVPVKEKDTYEYLRDLCYKGLKEKGLENKKEYIDRLEYELDSMHLAGLDNYMLIVSDYINWANDNGILTGVGRGSAAGSLISYLTNITRIDPIEYKLIYSRFFNVGRTMIYDFGI